MITGEITNIIAPPTPAGAAMQIHVNYEAFNDAWGLFNIWGTKLIAKANGYQDIDTDTHSGDEGDRLDKPSMLNLGIMPNHSVSGSVTLEAQGRVLDSEPFNLPLATKSEVISRDLPTSPPKLAWELPEYTVPVDGGGTEAAKTELLGIDSKWAWIGLGIIAIIAIFLIFRRR